MRDRLPSLDTWRASTMSSSPRWSGCTGSPPAGCSAPAARSRPPSTKSTTTLHSDSKCCPDSTDRASPEPVAVHRVRRGAQVVPLAAADDVQLAAGQRDHVATVPADHRLWRPPAGDRRARRAHTHAHRPQLVAAGLAKRVVEPFGGPPRASVVHSSGVAPVANPHSDWTTYRDPLTSTMMRSGCGVQPTGDGGRAGQRRRGARR
jgi:hypothetical protein